MSPKLVMVVGPGMPGSLLVSVVAVMMADMSGGHQHEPSGQIKRHARLRDIDLGRSLWAGNDADWKLILQNRYAVICDREGCRGPLVPNDCDEVNRRRHMSYRKGSNGGCGHHDSKLEELPETDRGMSERHRWMQNYITEACRRMGYSATPEHELTDVDGGCAARADVWVEPANMVFEVQQRFTNFEGRTAARVKGGAVQTVWMLSHDANSKPCVNALFTIPAVRFTVLDRRLPWKERWAREFKPWLDNAALDEFAVVGVWATTWQLMDEQPFLRTCKLDLQVFLREVLEGRRVWVSGDPAMPRSQYGSPKLGWVLLDDLDEVRARIARDEAASAASEPSEPEMSGAADDGTELPATSQPRAPRPPTPAPKPAPPARASVPPAAARPPARPARPAPKADVDWDRRLTAAATVVAVVFFVAFVWWLYVKVSGAVDGFEAWWDRFFHTPVPAYEPCSRGDPFCRY